MILRRIAAAIALAGLIVTPSLADMTIKDGTGATQTLHTIDTSNTGTTLCGGGVKCSASVNIDLAGAPFFVTGNPGFVTNNGTFAVQSAPSASASWGLFADNSAFTIGTGLGAALECEFTSGGATAITTARVGVVGCTAARGIFTDESSVSGTALASATEAYGTAFASQTATVERVDAFVTNANLNGIATAGLSSPVVEAVSAATALQTAAVANGNGTPLTVNGYNGAMIYVNCTVACSGGTTVTFQGSIDGTNFVTIQGQALATGTPATTATTTGAFAFNITGLQSIRAPISGYSAGTLTVTAVAGSAPAMQPSASSGSSAITSWGGGTLGAMANYGTSPGAVLVPGVNASVTNTVPVNQTQVNGAALSITNPSFTEITDGTNGAATIKAASTSAVATDKSLVVQINPQQTPAVNLTQVAGSTSGAVAVSVAPTTAGNVAQVVDLRPDSPGIIALGANTAANSVPMVPATDKVQGTPSSAVTGSYCMSSASGTMAAGLAANSPIFSLRYAGSGVALIRRVRFTANDGGTAFTAGTVQFQLFAARSYSVADTGGAASTLTGNNGKLRTSFASTSMADFRTSSTATLTAGTRTLDATPIGSWVTSVPATIATPIIGPAPLDLVRPESGEQPAQLVTGEGLVLQATVPATGVWVFAMQVCWDEVAAY